TIVPSLRGLLRSSTRLIGTAGVQRAGETTLAAVICWFAEEPQAASVALGAATPRAARKRCARRVQSSTTVLRHITRLLRRSVVDADLCAHRNASRRNRT